MNNTFLATTWAITIALGASTAAAQDAKPGAQPKPFSGKQTDAKLIEKVKPGDANKPAVAVSFPTDYRNWKHVKSMVIHGTNHPLFETLGGFHHVYANEKAVKGLMGGKGEYQDGAAFAFDLFEAPDANDTLTEGKRKFVATIVRDAKKYSETKKWGYQAWDEGDPAKPAMKSLSDQKMCAVCHEDAAAKSHVFTEWRP